MHLPNLIVDLALILATVAVSGILFKALKQPVVLGYIVAGVIVGPHFHFFPTVIEIESIRIWAEIGVIILLFNLGLEFSFKKLLNEGGRVVVIALFGVVFTALAGFFAGKMFGWTLMDSLFFGGLLSIASTTIIIRTFDELNVRTKKFTNIVTGVLVVEDIVAVLIMVVLSGIAISREFSGTELVISLVKLVFFLIVWFVSGVFLIPSVLFRLRKILNNEILLLFILALCFLVVNMALKAGFSPAFGAFIIGSILAESTKAERIGELIRPLKDLFGAIFFVSVGMLLDPVVLSANVFPVTVATLLLLVGKPLFIMTGSVLTGQPLQTAIQSGMSLSQIGEFSFIIASVGQALQVTGSYLYPIAISVSVLTAFTTPYMIKASEGIFRFADRILPSRLKQQLERYSISASRINRLSEWRTLIKETAVNILVYFVLVLFVIALSLKYIQPSLEHLEYGKIVTALVALLLSSPFLWAISLKGPDIGKYSAILGNADYRTPLLILQLIRILVALAILGFLFDRLFSRVWALAALTASVSLMLVFKSRLGFIYGLIEKRFIANLNERELELKGRPTGLTPWDTHLSTIRLHARVPFIGMTLLEAGIRERFGVNIAAIEREGIKIFVPDRYEKLYPNDLISVIGTDKQLADFSAVVRESDKPDEMLKMKTEVTLWNFVVRPDSDLAGKSIKESNLRELTQGLVVGIERDGRRILNPESSEVFVSGDIVWVVGKENRSRILKNKL